MRVWIDQDQCQNSGLCELTAPETFGVAEDDLAYVREGGLLLTSPGGKDSLALVEPGAEESVEVAARECPGQCIHIVGP
jgi:ferredoxin